MKVIRPYIPDDAFDWLKGWIRSDMRVFEFGSGFSTMWFGKNVAEVVSVENCEPFFEDTKRDLEELGITNVTYTLRDGPDYYNYINEFEEPFDLVFVDGRFRKECMKTAYDMAKYAILLDNADAPHYLDAYEEMKSYSNGRVVDFVSYGVWPVTGELLCTPDPAKGEPLAWKASVFLKDI